MVSMSRKLQSVRKAGTPEAIDSEAAWRQVLARNPEAAFLYAVTTTGVFCRPSCTSRRPLKTNVCFFSSVAEAQAAGFRACKRCKPTASQTKPLDRIRTFIEANLDRPVRLKELGHVAGMSPFTVQRLFKRQLGVSPPASQGAVKEPLHGERALQTRDGGEPARLPTRAQGALIAQRTQAGRYRDKCNLRSRIRIVEPRLRGRATGHDTGALCQRRQGRNYLLHYGAFAIWLDRCGIDRARPVLACARGKFSRGGSQLAH